MQFPTEIYEYLGMAEKRLSRYLLIVMYFIMGFELLKFKVIVDRESHLPCL